MKRAALPALLLAAACQMQAPRPEPQPHPEDACGAQALQAAVGRSVKSIDLSAAKGPVRIVPEGTAVTMDFSAERLTVYTDATGKILSLSCS